MSSRRIRAVITSGRFGDVHRQVNCAAAADTSQATAMAIGRRRGQDCGDAQRDGSDQQPEPHGAMGQPLAGEPPAQKPDRFVLLDLEHPRRDENDPEDQDQPDDRRGGDQWTDEWAHAVPLTCSSRRKTSTIRQKRPGCSRYAK